jgi:hypothetical protein
MSFQYIASPSSKLQQYLSMVAHINWTPCGSRLNLLGISEQIGALEVQCRNALALTNPIPSYGSHSNHEAMQIIAKANAKKKIIVVHNC